MIDFEEVFEMAVSFLIAQIVAAMILGFFGFSSPAEVASAVRNSTNQPNQ